MSLKNKEVRIAKNEGITLVALVVTIVILIILAALSISVAFGENGLIAKAKKAGQDTESALTNEQELMDRLGDEVTNIAGGSSGNTGSGGTNQGPLVNKYLTPINAVDLELFGREVNYSVPDEELAKTLGSDNKWLLLYRGNSFSENGETETYLIMKSSVLGLYAPAAVDSEGNKTDAVPYTYNGGFHWDKITPYYKDIPLEGNERFTPTNRRLCEFCKRSIG